MKKIICLITTVFFGLAIFGCASTKVKENEPVEYKEFKSYDFYGNYNFSSLAKSGIKGLKLKEAKISGWEQNGTMHIKIDGLDVDSTAYYNKTPDILERLENNREYTVYITVKQEGSFLSGYYYTPILDDIEGLRTIEEIKHEEEMRNKERLEKEKAEQELREKETRELKAKIETLAQGYILHGLEEASKNAVLFNKGALEPDHAYYLELFMTKSGGNLGSALQSIFSTPEYNYVTYINQKVRGEVTSAGSTIMGQLPVSVVVIGGKAPSYIPVVLGLVE